MPRYTIERLQERAMQNAVGRSPPIDNLSYGELVNLELSSGRGIVVNYGLGTVNYLVPKDAAWTAGVGAITIDKAYRILEEKEGIAKAREVKNFSELESVASGFFEEIQKILSRK